MNNSPKLMLAIFLGIILLIILVTFYNTYRNKEGFDITGSEFVPVGEDRYDLKGEKLDRIYVGEYYVRPDRHIKLNNTKGFVWNANISPLEQGNSSCKRVTCPSFPSNYDPSPVIYDNIDQCWECGNSC